MSNKYLQVTHIDKQVYANNTHIKRHPSKPHCYILAYLRVPSHDIYIQTNSPNNNIAIILTHAYIIYDIYTIYPIHVILRLYTAPS